MPEAGDSNIEIAHHLTEHGSSGAALTHEVLEILQAIVLAVVAIATAWSGYQAALWSGHQSELYGEAGKLRIEAESARTTANQERLYEASNVVEWLKAKAQGQAQLANLFERRFLREFRPAFEAWKKTDPMNNPQAPVGPQFMPEYRSSRSEAAARLDKQASEIFDKGTRARQRSDDYVRETVVLATVLLLASISQRFKIHAVRVGLVAVAIFLLALAVYQILTFPLA
jgi:hypothetical protein